MSPKLRQLIAEDLGRIFPKVGKKLESLFGSCVLITGGAGFMGSWVVELISYLNTTHGAAIKLYIVDKDRESFVRRFPHLSQDPLIAFIRCDARSILEMPREVNFVIHAAGTPDSRFHASSPLETMTTIAEGTSSALRSASRVSNLVNFVNVSSSAIYASDTELERITEATPCLPVRISPSAAYAEAKRYAEVLCAAARSEARVPVVTVRPFSFCGAFQNLDSPWALNNFISDALHQRPIRILGDGKSVRSLMYGADLAYWVLVIMLHGSSGQVFNVGSDDGRTASEIADIVASNFTPRPSILINTSLTGAAERSRLVPDVSAAKSEFGLDVYTDIGEAISKTIAWYRGSLI